jgi:hypothetical protein
MNLKQVRARFLEASGRTDLVNVDGSDNGADRFINDAQRWLDQRQDTPKSVARVVRHMPAGTGRLVFEGCRSVDEVWVANAEGRNQLSRQSLSDFRKTYPSLFLTSNAVPPLSTVSSSPTGAPLHYTVAIIGLAPQQEFLSAADFEEEVERGLKWDYGDIVAGDHYGLSSVLIGPVATEELSISIYGHFFSRWLTKDTDQSFWTTQQPALLVWAALYQMELHYSNMSRAQVWLEAINGALRGVDHDLVQQDLAGSGEMNG